MQRVRRISEFLGEVAGESGISINVISKVLKDGDTSQIYRRIKQEQFKERIHEHITTNIEGWIDPTFNYVSDTMAEIANAMEVMGIPIPEDVDFLPGATELILGVRLLMDIKAVNNDFEGISSDKKKNLIAAKSLVTLSKFGVTTTLVSLGSIAGGAGGAAFAGVGAFAGAPIGAVAGGFSARAINQKIAPHAQEISYKLLNIDKTDLFYYKNKKRIDEVGYNIQKSVKVVRNLEFRST